jgi:hypothetical protein
MLFFVLQNEEEKGLPGCNSVRHSIGFGHQLAVSLADDSTEEEKKKDADCVFCAGRFSEDQNVEDWTRCAKCCRWTHTRFAGMEENFVCNHCRG